MKKKLTICLITLVLALVVLGCFAATRNNEPGPAISTT